LKILQLTVRNPAKFGSKSAKMATLLSHFRNVIFRHHYVIQKNSSSIETEKLTFPGSSFQPPKFNIDKPTQLPGYSLWHSSKISHRTLKQSMTHAKKYLLPMPSRQVM